MSYCKVCGHAMLTEQPHIHGTNQPTTAEKLAKEIAQTVIQPDVDWFMRATVPILQRALQAAVEQQVISVQDAVEPWREEVDDLRAKLQQAMRGLESLTPSGSEFAGDIDACVAYVRKRYSTRSGGGGQ